MSGDMVESVKQTRERYGRLCASIVNSDADVVFLQECEGAFLDRSANRSNRELLANYEFHSCYGTRVGDGPGTVVLLKKNGLMRATGKAVRVGGTSSTGGTSKTACCVPVVTPRGATAWLISVHFTFSGNSAMRRVHAKGIQEAIGAGEGTNIVLAGDFNADLEDLDQMRADTWLGALERVDLGPGVNTGMDRDLVDPVCIDHICISPGLVLQGPPETEKAPQSPYGVMDQEQECAKIQGASDHVWIKARLAIRNV